MLLLTQLIKVRPLTATQACRRCRLTLDRLSRDDQRLRQVSCGCGQSDWLCAELWFAKFPALIVFVQSE